MTSLTYYCFIFKDDFDNERQTNLSAVVASLRTATSTAKDLVIKFIFIFISSVIQPDLDFVMFQRNIQNNLQNRNLT